MGQGLWLVRALLTIGGGPSYTSLLWALNPSAKRCPQGSGTCRQAVSLGAQPRMGGFFGNRVWDLRDFPSWNSEATKNARETLALEAPDSPAASPEEAQEDLIWLRGAGLVSVVVLSRR